MKLSTFFVRSQSVVSLLLILCLLLPSFAFFNVAKAEVGSSADRGYGAGDAENEWDGEAGGGDGPEGNAAAEAEAAEADRAAEAQASADQAQAAANNACGGGCGNISISPTGTGQDPNNVMVDGKEMSLDQAMDKFADIARADDRNVPIDVGASLGQPSGTVTGKNCECSGSVDYVADREREIATADDAIGKAIDLGNMVNTEINTGPISDASLKDIMDKIEQGYYTRLDYTTGYNNLQSNQDANVVDIESYQQYADTREISRAHVSDDLNVSTYVYEGIRDRIANNLENTTDNEERDRLQKDLDFYNKAIESLNDLRSKTSADEISKHNQGNLARNIESLQRTVEAYETVRSNTTVNKTVADQIKSSAMETMDVIKSAIATNDLQPRCPCNTPTISADFASKQVNNIAQNVNNPLAVAQQIREAIPISAITGAKNTFELNNLAKNLASSQQYIQTIGINVIDPVTGLPVVGFHAGINDDFAEPPKSIGSYFDVTDEEREAATEQEQAAAKQIYSNILDPNLLGKVPEKSFLGLPVRELVKDDELSPMQKAIMGIELTEKELDDLTKASYAAIVTERADIAAKIATGKDLTPQEKAEALAIIGVSINRSRGTTDKAPAEFIAPVVYSGVGTPAVEAREKEIQDETGLTQAQIRNAVEDFYKGQFSGRSFQTGTLAELTPAPFATHFNAVTITPEWESAKTSNKVIDEHEFSKLNNEFDIVTKGLMSNVTVIDVKKASYEEVADLSKNVTSGLSGSGVTSKTVGTTQVTGNYFDLGDTRVPVPTAREDAVERAKEISEFEQNTKFDPINAGVGSFYVGKSEAVVEAYTKATEEYSQAYNNMKEAESKAKDAAIDSEAMFAYAAAVDNFNKAGFAMDRVDQQFEENNEVALYDAVGDLTSATEDVAKAAAISENARTLSGTGIDKVVSEGPKTKSEAIEEAYKYLEDLYNKAHNCSNCRELDKRAAARMGLTPTQYAIRGINPEVALQTAAMLKEMEKRGLNPVINYGYRSDWHQGQLHGTVAPVGHSRHGGSINTKGYGDGQALDISAKNTEERQAVWDFVDEEGRAFGMSRPYESPGTTATLNDEPHIGPIWGGEATNRGLGLKAGESKEATLENSTKAFTGPAISDFLSHESYAGIGVQEKSAGSIAEKAFDAAVSAAQSAMSTSPIDSDAGSSKAAQSAIDKSIETKTAFDSGDIAKAEALGKEVQSLSQQASNLAEQAAKEASADSAQKGQADPGQKSAAETQAAAERSVAQLQRDAAMALADGNFRALGNIGRELSAARDAAGLPQGNAWSNKSILGVVTQTPIALNTLTTALSNLLNNKLNLPIGKLSVLGLLTNTLKTQSLTTVPPVNLVNAKHVVFVIEPFLAAMTAPTWAKTIEAQYAAKGITAVIVEDSFASRAQAREIAKALGDDVVIDIVGWSKGAVEAMALAEQLGKMGKTVNELHAIDPALDGFLAQLEGITNKNVANGTQGITSNVKSATVYTAAGSWTQSMFGQALQNNKMAQIGNEATNINVVNVPTSWHGNIGFSQAVIDGIGGSIDRQAVGSVNNAQGNAGTYFSDLKGGSGGSLGTGADGTFTDGFGNTVSVNDPSVTGIGATNNNQTNVSPSAGGFNPLGFIGQLFGVNNLNNNATGNALNLNGIPVIGPVIGFLGGLGTGNGSAANNPSLLGGKANNTGLPNIGSIPVVGGFLNQALSTGVVGAGLGLFQTVAGNLGTGSGSGAHSAITGFEPGDPVIGYPDYQKNYVPVSITVNDQTREIQLAREDLLSGLAQYIGDEGEGIENEQFHKLSEDNPIVFDDNGQIVYSNGLYAPKVNQEGSEAEEDLPQYIYTVRYVDSHGNVVPASTNESTLPVENILTKLIGNAVAQNDLFTINDVTRVRYNLVNPNPSVLRDEFYNYAIDLTNGTTRALTLPQYTSVAFMKQKFASIGYWGDVVTLVNKGVEDPDLGKDSLFDYLADAAKLIAKGVTDLAGTLFGEEETEDQYSDLNGELKAFVPTINNIDAIYIYPNADVICPDVEGFGVGYVYQTFMRDLNEPDDFAYVITEARCGEGDPLITVGAVGRHLIDWYGFEDFTYQEILDKTFFSPDTLGEYEVGISVIDLRNFEESPITGESDTEGDEPAEEVEYIPNTTNTVSFEAKARSSSGKTLVNWTSGNVSLPKGAELMFRWSGSDYRQCLLFLNDNGAYALSRTSDTSLTNGNTETENFNLNETTGIYKIECGGQNNREFGVDSKEIFVTVAN